VLTFVPNTIQIPAFIIEAAARGQLPDDTFRELVLVAAGYKETHWAEQIVNSGVIEQTDAPVESSSPPVQAPAKPDFISLLQTRIDSELKRPQPIPNHRKGDLEKMCQGRTDLADALVVIMKRYEESYDEPILNHSSFMFRLLRNRSIDELISEANSPPAPRRRSYGDQVYRRVNQRFRDHKPSTEPDWDQIEREVARARPGVDE
jgi:hypothetical protein